MGNVFSKFFVSFGLPKKNKGLPAPTEFSMGSIEGLDAPNYSVKPYKTIASFDISIDEPRYTGAIPDASIKFYPINKKSK